MCCASILARGASDGVGAGTGEGGGATVASGPDPAWWWWWSSAPAPRGAMEAKPILLRVERLGGAWAWAPAVEGAAAGGATTGACWAAASSVVVVVVVLVVVMSMGAGGGASEAMAGCGRVCLCSVGVGLNCVEGLLTTVASGSAFQSDRNRFQLDSMPPPLLRLRSGVWRFWIGWVHRSIDRSIGKSAGRLHVDRRTEAGGAHLMCWRHMGAVSLCHDDRPIN